MTKCQSYAQCCFLAPGVFRFEGEEALAYNPNPSDAERFRVLQSAAACPVQAIRVGGARLPVRPADTAEPVHTPLAADERVVIVGASLAGLTAAETLRTAGFTGTITVLGDEPHLPYDRPPLSKQVLTGVVGTTTTRLPHAADLDVDWRLGETATSLTTGAKQVLLQSGARVGYDRLLITTGRRSRPWPIAAEAALDGVVVLRTAEDAAAIRERLSADPRRVLVIGGGFTGGEIASSCSSLGIPVTVVDRGPAPMAKLFGTAIGEMMRSIHHEHDVDLRTGTSVTAMLGDDAGRLTAVQLTDGSTIDVDVAVVAIGAIPNSGWLAGSGIASDDGGVLCDAAHHALSDDGHPMLDVFVAGDIARHPNPLAGPGAWTSEHWGAAVGRAETAARNMVHGTDTPHQDVPVFWTTQFGQVLKAAGEPAIADTAQITQGSLAARSAVVTFGRDGRLVAAVAVNQSKWLPYYRAQIEAGAAFPLEDPTVDPAADTTLSAAR
ncbi:FAD-dependent oxidoreductase [Curtobacterium sp. VKM Ac-1393]|uniref:FAD-dependent oxidoreductase n=1 Tax=Curtobacterium sp. VKM Ac-1393 TaxID=2783814 RepID=UPI00188DACED|nr:FAD-dependent oxidoreductase [Curtobacterium sp. VKM Ac-1393]MBF4605948.1 FAD-dependent oxidoreductase [Curtobacterium sp. VKM Ac-1393]